MQTPRKEQLSSLGLLILRLGVGGYMLTHGWGKFQMLLGGKFEAFGDPIGMGPHLSLIGITLAEFFCAILVMLGLGTRFAAIPVVFAMGVAAFVVHSNDPWTMGKAFELFSAGQTKFPVSREPAMMFLFSFLALAFTGGGRFSLDALIFSRCCRRGADPDIPVQNQTTKGAPS